MLGVWLHLRDPGREEASPRASKRDPAAVPEGCWERRPSFHPQPQHPWVPRIPSPSGSRVTGALPSAMGWLLPCPPLCPRHVPVSPRPPPNPRPRARRPPPLAPRHSRDADLEEVVLDELLAQHDDAELDAELHQAAPRGALRGGQL